MERRTEISSSEATIEAYRPGRKAAVVQRRSRSVRGVICEYRTRGRLVLD